MIKKYFIIAILATTLLVIGVMYATLFYDIKVEYVEDENINKLMEGNNIETIFIEKQNEINTIENDINTPRIENEFNQDDNIPKDITTKKETPGLNEKSETLNKTNKKTTNTNKSIAKPKDTQEKDTKNKRFHYNQF